MDLGFIIGLPSPTKSLIHTSQEKCASISQLVHEGQQAIDTWAGGLRVTGGDIAPQKSHWFLVQFICNGSGTWKCDESVTDGHEMTLQMGSSRKTIERVPISEGRKALGVKMRHDGKEDEKAVIFTFAFDEESPFLSRIIVLR